MIKRYHPVSLNVVRGSLNAAGFGVTRIRTLEWPTDTLDVAILEVELSENAESDYHNWRPTDVLTWTRAAFSADVQILGIEYRRRIWFVRLKALGVEEVALVTGQLEMFFANPGNQETPSSGGIPF